MLNGTRNGLASDEHGLQLADDEELNEADIVGRSPAVDDSTATAAGRAVLPVAE